MNPQFPLPALLELLAKGAALTLAGLALHAAMRRSSAANRHSVLAAVFAALLLLPFTKLVTPWWSLELERPSTKLTVMLPDIIQPPGTGIPAVAEQAPEPAPVRTSPAVPWGRVVVLVWLTGAALLLARRAFVSLRLRALVRGSREISDSSLAAKVRALKAACRVQAEVRQSGSCRVPFVTGMRKPVVLLPDDAAEWSDSRLARALRHEFGHIVRRDCAARLLADIACALHWPNPFAWLAARRMRLAQEHACDDLVLNAGASADEYALQLVEAVRVLRGEGFAERHALAMAQSSTLESRVTAIVDSSRDRGPRNSRGAFAGAALAAAALALSTAAQLSGADAKKSPEGKGGDAPTQIEVSAKFIEVPASDARLAGLLNAPAAEQEAAAQALQKLEGADVLSSPRVVTTSGNEAKIEIGREMRYPTSWDKDAKTGEWKPKDFATKLCGMSFTVTPAINADGSITMRMAPEVTELERFVAFGTNVTAKADDARQQPVFTTRKMETTITVNAGHTVVLHGGGMSMKDPRAKADRPVEKQLVVLVSAKPVKPTPQQPGIPQPIEVQSDSATFDKKTGTLDVSGGVKIETPGAVIRTEAAQITPKPVAADTQATAAAPAAKADAPWVLPQVDFRDATLQEIVEYLVIQSKKLDPAGKGVNIVLKGGGHLAAMKVTLSLKDTAETKLRYVTV